VVSQFGLHIVQLTYKSAPVSKAQIATITYKVDPSAKTMQDIFSKATTFVTAAGNSAAGFQQAVSDEALSKRSIRIRNTDRTLSGLNNSKELIRWAFNGKQGDVSGIMEMDGDYLVAALTDVKEDGFSTVEQVSAQIRTTLLNEAKGEMIAAEMTGDSLDAIATAAGTEVKDATGVQYSGFYIPELGVEPALIGAMSALPQGQLSKPVKGVSGVYVFDVTGIVSDDAATTESEKARLDAAATSYLNERTMQALVEGSEVTDMRVKFF
jgi:peptidyl-prolyl cis-trans isomerase D